MSLRLVDTPNVTEQLEQMQDARRDLRRMGFALECAASTLTGAIQRCDAGQAQIGDFERAEEAHGFARDNFRDALERATGLSASTIERWLQL